MEFQSRAKIVLHPHSPLNENSCVLVVALDSSTDEREEVVSAFAEQLIRSFGIDFPDHPESHFYITKDKRSVRYEEHSEFTTIYLFFHDNIGGIGLKKKSDELVKLIMYYGMSSNVISLQSIKIGDRERGDINTSLLAKRVRDNYQHECFVCSTVIDRNALVAGDFAIDQNGFTKFDIVPIGDVGPQRLGRIVQRLAELEIYKNSCLEIVIKSQDVRKKINEFESRLFSLTQNASEDMMSSRNTLSLLISLSIEFRKMSAGISQKAAILNLHNQLANKSVKVLNEERVGGFQKLEEFMLRQFEPKISFQREVWARLENLSGQIHNTTELIRARVEFESYKTQEENLAMMNKRAATQLRIQEAVEGLSVIAISYYLISILNYIFKPLAKMFHIDETFWSAGVSLITITIVSLLLMRFKWRIRDK